MPHHAPLPRTVQIGYAAACVGLNAVDAALRLYLLIFYTDRVGLAPDLAGLALALGLVWDAVTDPWMGAISDRTASSRHGRRPYLWIGGLLLAATVAVLFHPPVLDGDGARFTWLLLTFCALNTAFTIVNVPHMAMAAELTAHPHERSVLFGWRFAAMNVGTLLAALLPATLIADSDGRTVDAMGPFSLVVGLVVAATALWTYRATGGVRFLAAPARGRPLLAEVKEALASRPFRPLLLAYVVATVGIGTNGAAALYYYRYRLELADRQVQVMVAVLMLVFTLSILLWVGLSKRHGKLRPVVIGSGALGVATSVIYLTLPPGNFWLPLVLGAVGLGSLIGCIVLIDSLLTDVIDHDCVFTGARRSGVFFGVWRFASKLARAAAVAGTGWILDRIGFVPNATQSDAVRGGLAVLFGPGVGLCFVAAAAMLACYGFDDRKQAQVRRILARRG